MKVTLSLNDDLVKRIDDYALEMFMKRSAVVSLACIQFLDASEGIKAVKDMSVAMRKLADKEGKIDDKMLQEIEDFERISNLLTGGK